MIYVIHSEVSITNPLKEATYEVEKPITKKEVEALPLDGKCKYATKELAQKAEAGIMVDELLP